MNKIKLGDRFKVIKGSFINPGWCHKNHKDIAIFTVAKMFGDYIDMTCSHCDAWSYEYITDFYNVFTKVNPAFIITIKKSIYIPS